MTKRFCMLVCAAVSLAACTDTAGTSSGAAVTLPESVIAMAAPNQDLSTVRVLETDGCYWYSHRGPVETTLLPLRNVEGRPICTRAQT